VIEVHGRDQEVKLIVEDLDLDLVAVLVHAADLGEVEDLEADLVVVLVHAADLGEVEDPEAGLSGMGEADQGAPS